ncbi:DUF2130 domain-containing protein [Mesorhizobium sp. M0715]|uniref:DUF2130 domain-containing protein n=1 Tax=Mesorhizobium sp. M0715 TaxID=2956990 RepID=UPI00333AB0ED
MPAAPSPVLKPAVHSHFHFDGQTCPYCDQAIPEDRIEEISGRIEARARERVSEETSRLRQQYAREKSQGELKAKADLEQAKQEAEAREALIRVDAVRGANEAARLKIVEAQKAQADAERARAGIATQFEEMRVKNEEAIERFRREAADREGVVRAEAAAAAKDVLRLEMAAVEGAKAEAEAARDGLAAELEAERVQKADDISKLIQNAAAREVEIREEAATAAQAKATEQILAAGKAKDEAERGRIAAELALNHKLAERAIELDVMKEAHIGELNAQREVLEKDKVAAVNTERANALNAKMRLEAQLGDMQRKLQEKTANELGEGAELDLENVLRTAFDGDRIRPVPRGTNGVDIIHEVVEGGKVVGKIVYDSKNRGNWASEYAVKLRKDQIAEKADFAILSTNKFPKDKREICTFEEVILASPARVLALAEILRARIVEHHELRVGSVEREGKMVELYDFINSPFARQLLGAVESLVSKMDQLDADEQNAHRKVWDKRAILRQAILKSNGDFRSQIRRIVGVVDDNASDGDAVIEE